VLVTNLAITLAQPRGGRSAPDRRGYAAPEPHEILGIAQRLVSPRSHRSGRPDRPVIKPTGIPASLVHSLRTDSAQPGELLASTRLRQALTCSKRPSRTSCSTPAPLRISDAMVSWRPGGGRRPRAPPRARDTTTPPSGRSAACCRFGPAPRRVLNDVDLSGQGSYGYYGYYGYGARYAEGAAKDVTSQALRNVARAVQLGPASDRLC